MLTLGVTPAGVPAWQLGVLLPWVFLPLLGVLYLPGVPGVLGLYFPGVSPLA